MDMPGDITAWYLHEDSPGIANVRIPTSGKTDQKWGTPRLAVPEFLLLSYKFWGNKKGGLGGRLDFYSLILF